MPKYEFKLTVQKVQQGNGFDKYEGFVLPLGIFEGETKFEAEKKCRKKYKNLINERSKLEVKEISK